ncbi:MAG: GNAT family N-acetyltransferase [Candidatus Omnitrophota bacterium]
MNFPLDIVAEGITKIFLGFLKKFLPKFINPKTIFCGIIPGPGKIGILDQAYKEQIIETIDIALEKIAKQEKASIIFYKDFSPEYKEILKPLLKRGFVKFSSLPNTIMHISFKTFNEYLNTLSRASREGFKRKLKKIDTLENVNLEISNTLNSQDTQRIYELYLETSARQGIQFETLTLDFFRNISQNLSGKIKFFLWRINNKIVAFALCLASRDYFIDYYLGFDYSIAYQYHLYFLRFRDLMNWCLNNNIKTYEMGATGYEAKRRLGFELIELYMYGRYRNKLFNPIFQTVGKFLDPDSHQKVFQDIKSQKNR